MIEIGTPETSEIPGTPGTPGTKNTKPETHAFSPDLYSKLKPKR